VDFCLQLLSEYAILEELGEDLTLGTIEEIEKLYCCVAEASLILTDLGIILALLQLSQNIVLRQKGSESRES
jgi:hypothetical protein